MGAKVKFGPISQVNIGIRACISTCIQGTAVLITYPWHIRLYHGCNRLYMSSIISFNLLVNGDLAGWGWGWGVWFACSKIILTTRYQDFFGRFSVMPIVSIKSANVSATKIYSKTDKNVKLNKKLCGIKNILYKFLRSIWHVYKLPSSAKPHT